MGRPSLKTPELIEAICDAIADGQSLRAICEADDMPTTQTIRRWLEDDAGFVAKYARAREAQADVMDDLILTTAKACDPENAVAARVKIDAFKWRASKLKPKVYGDKLGLVGGDGEGPVSLAVAVSFVKPDKPE